jgi:hypothetical protein
MTSMMKEFGHKMHKRHKRGKTGLRLNAFEKACKVSSPAEAQRRRVGS